MGGVGSLLLSLLLPSPFSFFLPQAVMAFGPGRGRKKIDPGKDDTAFMTKYGGQKGTEERKEGGAFKMGAEGGGGGDNSIFLGEGEQKIAAFYDEGKFSVGMD